MIDDKMIREAAESAMKQSNIGGRLFAVTRVQGKDAEWWIDFTDAERVSVRYDAGDTVESLAVKIAHELQGQD
jgi:hypothetical protein